MAAAIAISPCEYCVAMTKEYDELRIRMWYLGSEKYFALASGFVCGSAILDLTGAPNFHTDFDDLLKEDLGVIPKGERPIWERLQSIGDDLGKFFLPSVIEDCFNRCHRFAQQRNNGLRLRFFLPKTLSRIPIELLKTSGNFLALNQGISIVRSVASEILHLRRKRHPADNQEPFTIILASASPKGYKALGVDQEMTELQARLAFAIEAKSVKLVPLEHVTRQLLQSALEGVQGECALLMLGHGEYEKEVEQGVILLEDKLGNVDRVNQDVLAGVLAATPGLHFVALNLCNGGQTAPHDLFSGIAGRLIGVGIPMVVAFQFPVSDVAARQFSLGLVNEISGGSWIDKTVASARLTMHGNRTSIEWCTPMLRLHEHCDQTQLLSDNNAGQQVPSDGTVEQARWLVREARRNGGWKIAANTSHGATNRFPADSQLASAYREALVETELIPHCQSICAILAEGRPLEALNRIENSEIPPQISGLTRPLHDVAKVRVQAHRDLSNQYAVAKTLEKTGDFAGAYPVWREIRNADPDFSDVQDHLRAPFDVFVSYAAADFGLVQELCANLRGQGRRVWFQTNKDHSEALRGEELADVLNRCSSTVVCLTDAYCQDDDTKLEWNLIHTKDLADAQRTTVAAIIRGGPTRPVPHHARTIPWIPLSCYQQILQTLLGTSSRAFPSVVDVGIQIAPSILKRQARQVYDFLYQQEIGGTAPQETKELISKLLENGNFNESVRTWISILQRHGELSEKGATGRVSLSPLPRRFKT